MTINRDSAQDLINSVDFGERMRGINQMRQLDPKIAFEMVKPLLTDPNARIRYAAVSLLDTVGGEERAACLELLRDRLYNDPEVDVKAAAADAIGGLQLKEAFDDLLQVYQQTSEWLIQVSIVATLGDLGEPRGFDLLQEVLSSGNDLLITIAISALGELGDPRAVPLLAPFAADEDWQIRYRLAQALGNLGGEEARTTLERLAGDSQELVAQEARNNLTKAA